MKDRYLKIVLTVIALELGWLALTHGAQPVAAQRPQEPMPVVITGVRLTDATAYLPVGLMGQYRVSPTASLTVPRVTVDTSQTPLRVDVPIPLMVQVEPGSKPIRTEAMPYTPAQRPGE